MKKLPALVMLSVLVACGDSNTNSDSSLNSNTASTAVNTHYINANEISCNYSNGEEDFDAHNMNGDIISGVMQTEFDIIFPKNLSFKIIKELKEKAAHGNKISSNNFWEILSDNGRNKLNDYLLKNYGTLKDSEYNLKRRLTAYAFTIFTEIENYQQAISIKATGSKLFKDFTVAFSYDIRERVKLKHCLDSKITNINLPSNLLKPSDILTNVVCEDFYGDNTVSFQIHKDNKMYLSMDTEILLETIEFNLDDVEVNDRRLYKSLKLGDNEHKIDIKVYKKKTSNAYYDVQSRSYIYDTIKYLNINFERKGHQSIQLNKLDCKAVKPFII